MENKKWNLFIACPTGFSISSIGWAKIFSKPIFLGGGGETFLSDWISICTPLRQLINGVYFGFNWASYSFDGCGMRNIKKEFHLLARWNEKYKKKNSSY